MSAASPPLPAASPGPRVRWPAAGPGWLEVALPRCAETAVVAALPYPTEARLRQALGDTLDEGELRAAYSERVGQLLAQAAAHFRPDTVNLVVSHLFVAGGEESGTERPIQLGGAYAVEPAAFPAAAQYVALGHLHRPQTMRAPVAVRYSGSPLAYSFGEAGQRKGVDIVEVAPGQAPVLRTVALTAGRPLVRWVARGGLPEVEGWIASGRGEGAWIDLEVHLDRPLPLDAVARLREGLPGLVAIRPVIEAPDGAAAAAPSRAGLAADELFALFYRGARGCEPPPGVLALFRRLTTDVGEGGDGSDAAGVAADPGAAQLS